MEPESPWNQLPDEYLDRGFSSHRGYRAFQEYFGVKIKPEVINEYLLGEGICAAARIEVERFSSREMRGSLLAENDIRVIKRMLDLAKDRQSNGEETGYGFLFGLDAHDKPTRDVW
jgi:hypothetical protein